MGVGIALADLNGRPRAAITTASPSIRFSRTDVPRHVEVLRQAVEILDHRLAAQQH